MCDPEKHSKKQDGNFSPTLGVWPLCGDELPMPGSGEAMTDFIIRLRKMGEVNLLFQPCPECEAMGGCSGDCGDKCKGNVRIEVSMENKEADNG